MNGKSYFSKMLRFLFIALFVSQSFAMMSDGVHKQSDYSALATKFDAFDAVGILQDHSRHVMQTCVLISKDTVLTAAHGVENNQNPRAITISFDTKYGRTTYRANHVQVDPRYVRHHFDTLDFAIVTLEREVQGIEPAKILPTLALENNDPLIVATYGNRDVDPMFAPKKRAFYLLETDRYYHYGEKPDFQENVSLASIYFSPYPYKIKTEENFWQKIKRILWGGLRPLSEDEAEFMEVEILPRMREARKNWQSQGKPPYALALPGSSGAPVFIIKENSLYLLGMITSFSHLASPLLEVNSSEKLAEIILSTDRERLYGHFQTVFTLLYKSGVEPSRETYTIDPAFKAFVSP